MRRNGTRHFKLRATQQVGRSCVFQVERFFRDLTHHRLRRDSFASVDQLITAIDNYLAKQVREPKPFIWTAKASDTLEKVKRARAALDTFHNL